MRVFHWRTIPMLLMFCIIIGSSGISQPTTISYAQQHPQQQQRCFPETGYCIADRIREFWEQNGGLAVFGYPISGQQHETIEGKEVEVQWFERHRLELHPENKQPYDVLLGRITEEYLAQQGRDWHTFAQEPLALSSQVPCRVFEQTGHTVCGDFLTFWQSHGLEQDGVPGISEAESLALFGLPLSDPQTEELHDGNTYTVQWFERARMEYHPENNPPYHILLGLLSKEVFTKGGTMNTSSNNMPQDSPISNAHQQFAFNIYRQLANEKPEQNLFISPLSIATALAMVYNGADGATQQAMAQALALQGLTLEEVNEGNAALLQTLQSADEEVQLRIANALWAREGFDFEADFLQRNEEYYQAQVSALDFTNPATVQIINDWVAEQTEQKITKIIEELNPLAILLLTNAIYFKGLWETPFDTKLTEDSTFTLSNGTEKQHPMMKQSGKYDYYAGDGFQAVSLPYGEGRMVMDIFLPDEEESLETFSQQLNATHWQTWMSAFERTDGTIVLPRFLLEDERELIQPLTAMGMGNAFECGTANFRKLYTKEDTCISRVKHKTFVEVNEEGTEAAAVTAVEVSLTAALPTAPFEMIVDRPFFFAIRDTETGVLVFMGGIADPGD